MKKFIKKSMAMVAVVLMAWMTGTGMLYVTTGSTDVDAQAQGRGTPPPPSDINVKENIAMVDDDEVLAALT
uniref:Uncharacterized protein n=1 Tax=Candidatus Kentrum sp. LFY TaxID=2126342 RepID=A0A450W9U6_9GAMM|nr:MAG: hypothetical protein BECKLFY1418C_GA0070996_100454 [Candidatus Kentron sp. LFY]